MSRLDYHVTKVQGKMLLTSALAALAWSLLVYAALVWVVIVVGKMTRLYLPGQWAWFWSGLGVAVVLPIIYAFWRRPTRQRAAIAIDDKLGLKEKFSTALYVRPSSDPFAAAAVRDAEVTAERVHLQDKFPVRLPVASLFATGVAVVAFLTGVFLKPMDLLGRQAQAAAAAKEQANELAVKDEIKKAIARIDAAPIQVRKDEKIELAKQQLGEMLVRPLKDPTAAARKAQDALEDVKAAAQKIKDVQSQAQAFNEMKEWKKLADKPIDESGPVGKAQAQMAKGNFSEAVETLKRAVENFDKMDKKEQEKATQQMQAMAQQLQQMANNPQQQQQMQQQLQQMGATKQQAQQMQQAMQQAANGNKQAQQQLQQMTNQMLQGMNNGQGPSPQQIQQAQNMLQQMQQQAGGAAQAQQLAQNAAGLAKAMQQAAQGGQPQQAQAGLKGQPGGQQQPQQSGQPGGQQPQQQAGNQGAQQQAQQQMQQQIAQMQAMAQAAAAAQAGQQPGGDGSQPGQPGGQQAGGGQDGGGDGQQQAGGQQPGGGQGEFQKGDPNQGDGGEAGGGGPGMASGRRPGPQAAPVDFKSELSRSDTIDKGKILAASFVKAGALKGDSKAKLQKVLESAETETTDEVDQTRVPRQAREAVKEYYRSIQEDAEAAPAPAPDAAPAPAAESAEKK